MTDGSGVDFRNLSRSIDVELTLQDVVDDGLAQVIHHVTVTVLKSQSGKEKSRGFLKTISLSLLLRLIRSKSG